MQTADDFPAGIYLLKNIIMEKQAKVFSEMAA
jgi:hypothetical protein